MSSTESLRRPQLDDAHFAPLRGGRSGAASERLGQEEEQLPDLLEGPEVELPSSLAPRRCARTVPGRECGRPRATSPAGGAASRTFPNHSLAGSSALAPRPAALAGLPPDV